MSTATAEPEAPSKEWLDTYVSIPKAVATAHAAMRGHHV